MVKEMVAGGPAVSKSLQEGGEEGWERDKLIRLESVKVVWKDGDFEGGEGKRFW